MSIVQKIDGKSLYYIHYVEFHIRWLQFSIVAAGNEYYSYIKLCQKTKS